MSRYKVINIHPDLTDEERKKKEAEILRKLVEIIHKDHYSQEKNEKEDIKADMLED